MSSLVTALAFVLAACACQKSSAADAPAPDKAAIEAAISNPERSEEDRKRDAWAKPEAILTFLGARPGMKVIDYLAGDGYYSELLSHVVGPKGKVIVYNNGGYAGYIGQELVKRFANRRLTNTEPKVTEISALKLPDNSLDAALFVMSYHDVYYKPEGYEAPMGEAGQMVGSLFKALKPGGVVVVQDHVAKSGSDPADTAQNLHRINPEAVKQAFTQAGFEFDGEDNSLKNSQDDHTKLVFDESIRHKTDQFIYRFRKPSGAKT
jgi:predicted methyltransferase